MKSPTTTAELAGAIESLIASYMNEVRSAAEQAVARALVRQERGYRPPRSPSIRARAQDVTSSTTRRTAAALDEACRELCDVVRARPGSSIVELAEQLGSTVRELQRPMAKLRTDGRVRTVGQRHLTRYFPAIAKASRE